MTAGRLGPDDQQNAGADDLLPFDHASTGRNDSGVTKPPSAIMAVASHPSVENRDSKASLLRALTPALTPPEWRDCETIWPVAGLSTTGGGELIVTSAAPDDESFVKVPAEYRHAVAALALYKQAYGFTADDVRHLRVYATILDGQRSGTLSSIADRIAALLPPEQFDSGSDTP